MPYTRPRHLYKRKVEWATLPKHCAETESETVDGTFERAKERVLFLFYRIS